MLGSVRCIQTLLAVQMSGSRKCDSAECRSRRCAASALTTSDSPHAASVTVAVPCSYSHSYLRRALRRGVVCALPPVILLFKELDLTPSFGPFASIRARLVGSGIGAIRKGKTEWEQNGKSLCGTEILGWETWTRTRIARFRVWSPTNWTISQPMGGKKETAA
jgi:hypothetical protein